MPPPALDWLLRAIAAQEATTRLRDLALLALLSDCGLRAQEAADVQLRDLDLDGVMLTVRSGKGRNARRVPLTAAVVRTFRDYLKVRCPQGVASDRERGRARGTAMKRNVAKVGQPWEPGRTPNAMRKHLTELGRAAAERIQAQATKESSLERVAELEALAQQVAAISPHPLRHGLAYRMWKTVSPAHIQTILGHSRVATTLKYGKPTEDDLRAALEEASRMR